MSYTSTKSGMKNLVYAQERFSRTGGVVLAGPTPRDEVTQSWRPSAIKILEELKFDGNIFIPEMRNGNNIDFEYDKQIEWEHECLETASVILFWVPRELKSMPAFTTNIEWGYWTHKDPSKLVLGYPENTPKMDYMTYYAKKLGVYISNDLEVSVKAAIELVKIKEET